MPDPTLLLPLAIIFLGALVSALAGLPPWQKRLSAPVLGWVLALAPLAALVQLILRLPGLESNLVYTWQTDWMPSVGLHVSLYLDSLGALFALLVTAIGTLVTVYAGQYFKGETGAWRFFSYLMLFMGAMLGLVMAGDVLTLFIFWEATSILSFLLVAYKSKDEDARRGAFKALFITAGGGIALLIGLLFVAKVVGDTRFMIILDSGETLRRNGLYPIILILVAIGAFTKSAQFPFHGWLPDAMSAPTPASAYLHSATMVKAGIYLLARMNPVLGLTEFWFWLLTLTGMATMLAGAVVGLKKNDLKAILACTTICQLGILIMMIGQDMEISFKALVIGILAHALYKSALFLVAGIVDHETGTRDILRLGGLRRTMPVTFMIATLAVLSMAGLPPLFGFLAKETLLATAVHPSLPEAVAWILVLASVLAGALLLAISLRLMWETFMGSPKDDAIESHEAPWAMLLAPAIPALASLVLGQLPGPKKEAALLANAAGAAYGADVKISLALWTGLNIPLLLSGIAISAGVLVFVYRRTVISLLSRIRFRSATDFIYLYLMQAIDSAAKWALHLQNGRLRFYLSTILAGTVIMVLGFSSFPVSVDWASITGPSLSLSGELVALRIVALFIICGTSLACVLLYNDFHAILAFGASGLGVAVLMALEPAPDLALVQIVVDILLVIILVLALSRLPAEKLQRVQKLALQRKQTSLWRDALLSTGFGLLVAFLSLQALLSRPRNSALTPFFEAQAKSAVGSNSIVGAILTDFRGVDTLIEIAVFGIAGLGIFTLLCTIEKKMLGKDTGDQDSILEKAHHFKSLGIGGAKASPLIRGLARLALPLAMTIGVCDLLYGHDKPGDGFTAGVVVGIGIGFWYVAFGYEETRERLKWLKPSLLIGWGVLSAALSGIAAMAVNGSFFSNVDFGHRLGLSLPTGVHLTTSFIFEGAIAVCVVGSVAHMLNTLGRPEGESSKWSC